MRQVYLIVTILIIASCRQASAQGCVAIRSNGNTCSAGKAGESKDLIFNFNTCYFKSYKHFVGTEEQHERVDEGTEVINHYEATGNHIQRDAALLITWSTLDFRFISKESA